MKIVGYTDRLSVRQGESIRFMVSCELEKYEGHIVRLIHGDENPKGPGLKEEVIKTSVSGEYPGRTQAIIKGSYISVPDSPPLRQSGSLSLQAWIYSTTPWKGAQGIISKWSPVDGGYGLGVDKNGCLNMWIGKTGERLDTVSTGQPIRASEWYFVAGSYNEESRTIVLTQEPLSRWPLDESNVTAETGVSIDNMGYGDSSLLIGAYRDYGENGEVMISGYFNGKIENPRLYDRSATLEQFESIRLGNSCQDLREALVGDWDFTKDFSSTKVTDTGPNSLHGRTVNMPARAMKGHNWTGNEVNYNRAPQEYGSIHFHDDDLDDAGWDVDFEFTIPSDMRSGVYAARLRTKGGEDYVPFFVRPAKATSNANTVFLVPTLSYLAYGNDRQLSNPDLPIENISPIIAKIPYPQQEQDKYMIQQGLTSLYDLHSDGSGVSYSSRLRPILNMRPKYNWPVLGGYPSQLNADLHILDWMEVKGHDYDVVTDEDLHFEGVAALTAYKVVVTGTHPEYWSGPMLAALEIYLNSGGRLMYLGGNGFYWVTSIDPEKGHTIEVRRWRGTQAWEISPGEGYHSTTGELGSLWRFRGKEPQRLVGVGMTSQGIDRNSPYQRKPDSFDPRAAFIFEGIGKEELIGDFDSLVLEYGAAGFELDRVDYALGTPAHTLVLASSSGHSEAYQHVIEEVNYSNPKEGGPSNPLVRADIVYFEYPNDGAVFSVGSISWGGSLSYNQYKNNVSRITDNVLTRFSSEDRLT